jgi:nucleoside-diphosphate-sugar epimerase
MLGAALVSVLKAKGVEVIAVGRGEDSQIRLDLEHGFLDSVPENLNADVIFHCAASFADDSNEGLKTNFNINTAGSLWVLELAESLGSNTLIYAGSVSSLESFQPGNYSSYGLTKAQGEQLLEWGIRRNQGRFCSLRFPQIYDTQGECIRHQLWFGRIIAYAAKGLDINMPPSDGVRNFLHLEDAAHLMVAAEESGAEGVLDVVYPQSYTYQEIAAIAYSVFGKGGQCLEAGGKTPFRHVNFPDSAKVFDHLGVRPSVSLADGIARIRDTGTSGNFGPLDVT